MRFTDTKSETLNLRVSATFKHVLRQVADCEQRSMVNMLEVLVSDYCDRKGIALSAQQTDTSLAYQNPRASRKRHVGVPA